MQSPMFCSMMCLWISFWLWWPCCQALYQYYSHPTQILTITLKKLSVLYEAVSRGPKVWNWIPERNFTPILWVSSSTVWEHLAIILLHRLVICVPISFWSYNSFNDKLVYVSILKDIDCIWEGRYLATFYPWSSSSILTWAIASFTYCMYPSTICMQCHSIFSMELNFHSEINSVFSIIDELIFADGAQEDLIELNLK
jgi:hypothetical protein